LASCGPLRSKHPCRYSYGDLRHERNISGLRPVTSREQKDDAACTGARAAETGGALQDHQGNPMRVLRPRRIRAEGWPFSRRHSTFGYGLCAKSVLRARPVKFDRTGKSRQGVSRRCGRCGTQAPGAAPQRRGFRMHNLRTATDSAETGNAPRCDFTLDDARWRSYPPKEFTGA
jgi:hypothetical protein